MTKRKLQKLLQSKFDCSKSKIPSSDFSVINNNSQYEIIYIKTNHQSQVTFNSPYVIEIANGKLDGIRYKKRSSRLLKLFDMKTVDHKVIFFEKKPYRVLQYLNESDIVNVSNQQNVLDFTIIDDENELIKLISN